MNSGITFRLDFWNMFCVSLNKSNVRSRKKKSLIFDQLDSQCKSMYSWWWIFLERVLQDHVALAASRILFWKFGLPFSHSNGSGCLVLWSCLLGDFLGARSKDSKFYQVHSTLYYLFYLRSSLSQSSPSQKWGPMPRWQSSPTKLLSDSCTLIGHNF